MRILRIIGFRLDESQIYKRGLSGRSQPQRLNEISGDAEERMALSIGEFARVLGGGRGARFHRAGGWRPWHRQIDPHAANGHRDGARNAVLYVSGEESERQIKMRAMRLLQDPTEARPACLKSCSW